jgi:hypothetical protein
MLTPFARFAFEGPAPLNLITANVRGAGKGLCCDAIGIVFSGRRMAATPSTNDDDEMRKRITSIALGAESLVLLDNIKDKLGTASLDAALTSTEWKDRRLGLNEQVCAPLNATWFATGNNTRLDGDLARRTLHIRIESEHENPEERTGFRRPNLREWLLAERPRLAAAAVTVLRAYFVAGRPDMRLSEWGSFEGWSRLIRHAIVWCGLPDPGLTREALRTESDTDALALGALLRGWNQLDPLGHGMTVRQAIERLGRDDDGALDDLRDALDDLTSKRAGQPLDPRRIGYALRRFNGRVVDGMCMRQCSDMAHGGVMKWKVITTASPPHHHQENEDSTASERGPGGDGGNGGDVFYPYVHARAPAHAHARTEPNGVAVADTHHRHHPHQGELDDFDPEPDGWVRR